MSEDELTKEELELAAGPIEEEDHGYGPNEGDPAGNVKPEETDESDPKDGESDSTGDGSAGEDDAEEGQITEDLKVRAQSYGLNPDAFQTSEALEQQVLAIDQQWANYARQSQQQVQQQVPQDGRVQPVQTQQQDATVTQQQNVEVPFKLDLNPDEFPSELIEKMNSTLEQVHKYYSPLQETVEKLQQQIDYQNQVAEYEQQQRVVEDFNSSVKSLGHASLFGDGQAITPQQNSNLEALYNQADALAAGYQVRNMPVPSIDKLVADAEKIVFADQLKNFHAQTANARLKKQSNKRLGSGTRKTGSQGRDEWDGDIEDNPKLIEAWNNMVEERGER